MEISSLRQNVKQFRFTIQTHRTAIPFIRKHQLWKGFWKYGWVTRFLIAIAIILWLKIFTQLVGWWNSADSSDPVSMAYSMGSLVKDFTYEGFNFLFFGGMKYVFLVLLEILVFHFSRMALRVLSGQDSDSTFEAFLTAQIRMIKVAALSWFGEVMVSIILGIFFKIFLFGSVTFLKPVAMLIVQCFFLGFAIMDNYFEQFDLDIRESFKKSIKYLGVALSAGAILYLMLLIPVFGTIFGPILVAVSVTIVLYKITEYQQIPKKEKFEMDPIGQ